MTYVLSLLAAAVALVFLGSSRAEGSVTRSGGLGAALPQPPKMPAGAAPRATVPDAQASNPGAATPGPQLPTPPPAPAVGRVSSGGPETSITPGNFAAVLRPVAEQMALEYGIRPELALAQWAHETGRGTGAIFKATLNLGSITAGSSWAYFGQDKVWHALPGREVVVRSSIEYVTRTQAGDEILEDHSGYTAEDGTPLMKVRRQVPFRKYPTLLAAGRDWADLISKSSRYAGVYDAAKRGDVEAFAKGLVAAGYASDPVYAAGVIRNYAELA